MTPRSADEATTMTDFICCNIKKVISKVGLHRCSLHEWSRGTLMHESLKPHQAHGNLLVLLVVVFLSLFGLLGVYASERTISAQQRGLGKEVGEYAASRKTLLWKGAEQIPRLLHRLELSGSGELLYAAPEPTTRRSCP